MIKKHEKTVSVWRGRVVRGIALMFLVFIGADAAFPQLCAGDASPVESLVFQSVSRARPVNSEGANEAAQTVVSAGKSDSQDERQSDDAPPEQHCIACCAHVLPATGISFSIVIARTVNDFTTRKIALPSAPVLSLFRPPQNS